MLRIFSLLALFNGVWAASDLAVVLPDDDLSPTNWRIRVSFRGDTDESTHGSGAYNLFSCSDTGAPEGGTEAVQIGSMKDQKKDRVPTGSGGMAAFYNSSTGIQTIKNRGGYSNSESQDLQLDGPGMLYTAHLDVEPRDDYIEVTDAGGHSVRLTGNYSACIQARTGLESIYMDKNLAPGTHYSESNDDYHNTEETQNHQDDLCHNVLTGKILMPDPVSIAGLTTLKWRADSDDDGGADSPGHHSSANDFYEGFELLMVFQDMYTADVSGTDTHVCLETGGGVASVAVTDEQGGNGGPPPAGTPSRVYFKDNDLNKLKISGNVEIQADGGAETSYLVTLEKFEPAGRWGYISGQLSNDAEFSQTERSRDGTPYGETTVYGPRDSWGHKGAELPYYPTGGSTGTEAPRLMGGGPAGARVFNKHGDVIGGSARGGHPDYQAAEELIDVESWGCDCGGKCQDATDGRCQVAIARQSGEANGAGLQRSQGSPPAPMYQLRVRSCDSGNCNMRESVVIQLIDIAEYEPDGTWYGDVDPKSRVLQGMITVVTPAYAMGIRGYRLYPTTDGTTNLPLVWSDTTAREQTGDGARSPNPQFIHVLDKHCPPLDVENSGPLNTDQAAYCQPGSPDEDEQ